MSQKLTRSQPGPQTSKLMKCILLMVAGVVLLRQTGNHRQRDKSTGQAPQLIDGRAKPRVISF